MSCGYQGHEFGANYPDSVCVEGRLFDADNCDEKGLLYEPLDFIPCPQCNHDEWIEAQREDICERGVVAGYDGLPRESCPQFTHENYTPEDRVCLRLVWLDGHDKGIELKQKE